MPRLGSFTAQYPDIRLTLIPSNDPKDIRAPQVDVCVLYGDGSWTDCWMRKWSGLELFPVVSPTLINNRPIRTCRDLADHVILHGDDGREWHTWLAAADGLDLERGRRHHHERRAHCRSRRRCMAMAWRSAIRSPPAAARQGPAGGAVQPVGAGGRRFLCRLPQRDALGADRARCSSTGCLPRRNRPTAAPTRRWPAASASAASARRCGWSAPRPLRLDRSGVLFVGPVRKAGSAFKNSMLISSCQAIPGKVYGGFPSGIA